MRNRRRGGGKWRYLFISVALLGGYSYWTLHRPLPAIEPTNVTVPIATKPLPSRLNWPPGGQAAVGIIDTDILETHGEQKPAPIASVAKVITCLVVLDAKPLPPGQQGPIITLRENDVDIFRNYVALDGSLVPVINGEQISQYQMLQAIMLPSANNIADSMAIWAFGSLKNYAAAANKYLAEKGLNNTHVGDDASGLSPTTTSTAADLIKLGKLAMKEPVLKDIVRQATATGIPQTNIVRNYNSLLGTANIIGIKTGNTDQAGGVFLSASQTIVNDQPVTIVTSVVGAMDLASALRQSQSLVESAQANFTPITVITRGTKVAEYDLPWNGTIKAAVDRDLSLQAWNGSVIRADLKLNQLEDDTETSGKVLLPTSGISTKKSTEVKLTERVPKPSAWWRLTHPYGG